MLAFDRLKSLGVVLFLGIGLTLGNAFAQQGKTYTLITPPQPTETGKNIEVLEVFYYGCPHCFDLEPSLNAWVKQLPKDVTFRRLPAIFRDSWVPLTKAYYTLEALGLTEKLHGDIFNAMHVENINLSDEKTLFDWMAKHGVDSKTFADTYNSFSVQSKVMRAKQLTKAYGVTGVPSLIVDGKYLTSSSTAGSHAASLQVADQLIKQARQERKSPVSQKKLPTQKPKA